MHDPPPSVYENWPAPNYVDPETRGYGLTISNSVLIPIVVLVVWARCWTRIKLTGSFGLDDVFIVAAMIPCLGLTAAIIATDVYHLNRHIWDTPADDVHKGLMLEFACALLYIWSSVLTKLSVTFFCRRLLSPSHPGWYRGALNVFAALTMTGNIAYTLTFVLSCQPLSAYWDQQPPAWRPDYEFTCIDIPKLWLSGSLLNLIWDILTWLVPLPIVWQLHLPVKQRTAVIGLFSVGVCVIIASVLKTIYIYEAFFESYDMTWVGWPTWICGGVEVSLGIICASAPGLRPLISHFCPRPGRVFGVRHSYCEMSRGVDVPGSVEVAGMELALSPMSPTHQRGESINSADDMKPWAHNSRGSSRNTSRRGSLGKLDVNPMLPKSSSAATTPNTLSPGTPIGKRLTPVREIEPIPTNPDDDFKFNQTASLPLSDDEMAEKGDTADDRSKSPVESPVKVASPTWWRSRPRTASSPRKAAFDRERKGSVSSAHSDQLQRSTSAMSHRTKHQLKLEAEMDAARAYNEGLPDDVATSPSSMNSRSANRHSHKPSAAQEFFAFDFKGPATSSRRDSDGAEAMPQEVNPPPSYGEFVETNSWIRDDRTTGRRSMTEPEVQSHAI